MICERDEIFFRFFCIRPPASSIHSTAVSSFAYYDDGTQRLIPSSSQKSTKTTRNTTQNKSENKLGGDFKVFSLSLLRVSTMKKNFPAVPDIKMGVYTYSIFPHPPLFSRLKAAAVNA
jgi:hypothetical protein